MCCLGPLLVRNRSFWTPPASEEKGKSRDEMRRKEQRISDERTRAGEQENGFRKGVRSQVHGTDLRVVRLCVRPERVDWLEPVRG